MENRFIGWNHFCTMTQQLGKQIDVCKYDGIFGIPRGGLIVGVILSHQLNLPLVEVVGEKTLIVDDITETGQTYKKTKVIYPNNDFISVLYKPVSDIKPDKFYQQVSADSWIVFPWEDYEKVKQDCEQFRKSRGLECK